MFKALRQRVQAYLAQLADQLARQQHLKSELDHEQEKLKTDDGKDPAPSRSDLPAPTNQTQAAPTPEPPQAIPAGDVARPAADASRHHDDETRRSPKPLVPALAMASLFQGTRLISYRSRRRKLRRRSLPARKRVVKGGAV